MNTQSRFTVPMLEPRLRIPFTPRPLSMSVPGSTRGGRKGVE